MVTGIFYSSYFINISATFGQILIFVFQHIQQNYQHCQKLFKAVPHVLSSIGIVNVNEAQITLTTSMGHFQYPGLETTRHLFNF